MKKIYVLGSTSNISKKMEKYNTEQEIVFLGRKNPFNLKRFIKYQGIDDEESVEKLFKLIVEDVEKNTNFESINLVILSGVSSYNWRESFLVNEYMPAVLSDLFMDYISKKIKVNSSVVLIGSSGMYQGSKLPYATTKASLIGTVHSLSKKYREKARINLIVPSAFDSGMISDWNEKKRIAVSKSNYIGRLGRPEDISNMIICLIHNNFITNSIVNLSGGTLHI